MTPRERSGDFSQVARQVVQEAVADRDPDHPVEEDMSEARRLLADPTTGEWVDEAHKSLTDGSFDERVRTQLSPADLAAKLKAERG